MSKTTTKADLSTSIVKLAKQIATKINAGETNALKVIVDGREALAELITTSDTREDKDCRVDRKAFVRLARLNRVEIKVDWPLPDNEDHVASVAIGERVLGLILAGAEPVDAAGQRLKERDAARRDRLNAPDAPYLAVNRAMAKMLQTMDDHHHDIPSILGGPRGEALASLLRKVLDAADQNKALPRGSVARIVDRSDTLSLRDKDRKVRQLRANKCADPSESPHAQGTLAQQVA